MTENRSQTTTSASRSRKDDPTPTVPVMDYEGSNYRNDFWDTADRCYEDAIERVALTQLLPPSGRRLAEIGAGYGRLADAYHGYEQVILFDYSRTMLQDALQRWGKDERFLFVAGNVYQLPLATGLLDTLVMVRVLHHLADVPAALSHIQRVLHTDSTAVLEYANKRNLKAIARWLTRRQSWSPFNPKPVEFVSLNFNFHPAWMDRCLHEAGLVRQRRLAVSHFRLPALKRRFSSARLVRTENMLLGPGGRFPLSPSVFMTVRLPHPRAKAQAAATGTIAEIFRCPNCAAEAFEMFGSHRVQCSRCGRTYGNQGGVWDFKVPLS